MDPPEDEPKEAVNSAARSLGIHANAREARALTPISGHAESRISRERARRSRHGPQELLR
jgi:hypothetical protein